MTKKENIGRLFALLYFTMMVIGVVALSSFKEASTLKLHGHVINTDTMHVVVFEYDEEFDGKWHDVYDTKFVRDYHIQLNPDKNYQIWFANKDYRFDKVLHVEEGGPGRWKVQLDADFSMDTEHLLLFKENGKYTFRDVSGDWAYINACVID